MSSIHTHTRPQSLHDAWGGPGLEWAGRGRGGKQLGRRPAWGAPGAAPKGQLTLSQPLSRPDDLLARVLLGGAATSSSALSCLKFCLGPDRKQEVDSTDKKRQVDSERKAYSVFEVIMLFLNKEKTKRVWQ